MKEDIDAIQVLVDEILKAIRKISGASNNLMLKQGVVVNTASGDPPYMYIVTIDGINYKIKSYVPITNAGAVVNVLCSINGTTKCIIG